MQEKMRAAYKDALLSSSCVQVLPPPRSHFHPTEVLCPWGCRVWGDRSHGCSCARAFVRPGAICYHQNMHLHSRCGKRAIISPTITNTCPVALPGLLNGQTNIHQGEVRRWYHLQPWLLISRAAAPLTRDVNTLFKCVCVCAPGRVTCTIHHRLFTLSDSSGVAICQRLTPESTAKPYVNNGQKKIIQ